MVQHNSDNTVSTVRLSSSMSFTDFANESSKNVGG